MRAVHSISIQLIGAPSFANSSGTFVRARFNGPRGSISITTRKRSSADPSGTFVRALGRRQSWRRTRERRPVFPRGITRLPFKSIGNSSSPSSDPRSSSTLRMSTLAENDAAFERNTASGIASTERCRSRYVSLPNTAE